MIATQIAGGRERMWTSDLFRVNDAGVSSRMNGSRSLWLMCGQ